ncbi:MAG: ABC transporter permease subunit [[Clostridium] innocuum]
MRVVSTNRSFLYLSSMRHNCCFGAADVQGSFISVFLIWASVWIGQPAAYTGISSELYRIFHRNSRGGIQSIDEGQKEAAKLLGYSNSYTFLHILLPQALRNCIPSFINESLTLLKDTCLVSILGIDELLRYAKIAAGTYATGLPFIYVGMIYLVLNMPISRGLNYLEKRLNYYK